MQNSYLAINASAGSGKTYSLVQRLLMICLRYPNQPDAIRNILALTFTNKAANEMKERILDWLTDFASDDYRNNNDLKSIQEAFKNEKLNVTIDDLHLRAKDVLDYILHHYSTLNISTIDKFNSRLVRSFSYELGLAQNFNLEIQAEPFLIEAVDQMLDDIGQNEEVSEAFLDYINYGLDNNERVNLSNTLYQSAKTYVSDVHYGALKANENFESNAYNLKKNELRDLIKSNKSQSLKIANDTLNQLKDLGLTVEDFAGGKQRSIFKFFNEVASYYKNERDKFPFPANEESALTNFAKGNSAAGKSKDSLIFSVLDQLLEKRMQLIALYIETKKKDKVLKSLLPLKVNSDIQKKLKEIEDENDLVLLSKFNVLINENLKSEPSSFIYEKVGTQYQHFFFDEFQDTSTLQWENFLPLRDHNISSEYTSFTIVGDPKQSIYRFRGGDSQLMLDIINHKELTPQYADVLNLEYNWRSAKNIVDFNNALYQYMSQGLEPEHQLIFGENAAQKSQSTSLGRVRVNVLENSTRDLFYENTATKMQQDIQSCLDNGFQFSDITILCRGNFDILSYSQLLSHIKVNNKGEDVYIKTISDNGLTLGLSYTIKALIAYLSWDLTPKNLQHLIKFLYYLKTLGKITINDFTAEILPIIELKEPAKIEKYIKEKFGLILNPEDRPNLNLYNYIEYYIQEFSVEGKETDFLLSFLEMLFNFTQNAGATQKDFLKYWEEEASKQSIKASDNIDAIQIMTIHKAKGLEFPIVMIPMQNEQKDSKFSDWYDLQSDDELKAVHISGFDKDLETYDKDTFDFNEKNRYRNKVDRYCVQYVATTRPVEQLFLYLENENKTANHLEILDYINTIPQQVNVIEDDFSKSFDLYPVDSQQLLKQKKKEKTPHNSQDIESIKNGKQVSDSIRIATPSKNYQNRVEHVRIGIFTHEILSKINTKHDIHKVLEAYLLEGIITSEEQNEIETKLNIIINNEKYKDYFAENSITISEREIMISENNESKILRPDRMIDTKDGFIIIDFKTGKEKEDHQDQLENYKKALEKIGKKVLKTEVIYIR
ncbi:UvrD-helicase domain-containing protein [Chryseobacterium sp. T1]